VRELEARGISNSTARRYIERAAPFVSKADGVYTLTEPTQEALIANAHEPMSAVPSGEADAHDAHARSHDALSVI
jgi:hypothetical protein